MILYAVEYLNSSKEPMVCLMTIPPTDVFGFLTKNIYIVKVNNIKLDSYSKNKYKATYLTFNSFTRKLK